VTAVQPFHRNGTRTGLTELSERLAGRRRRIEGQREAMTAERERLTGQGVLPPLAVAAFRRGVLRLEAELRWHEEFGRQLAAGVAGRRAGRCDPAGDLGCGRRSGARVEYCPDIHSPA
jgi:hypothetical protein